MNSFGKSTYPESGIQREKVIDSETKPTEEAPIKLGVDSLRALLNLSQEIDINEQELRIANQLITGLKNQILNGVTRIFTVIQRTTESITTEVNRYSPTNMMPAYINQEYKEGKEDGLPKEKISGGRGVFRNVIHFKPISPSSDYNFIQKLNTVFNDHDKENQDEVKKVYDKVKGLYNLPHDFNKRFLPENIIMWTNVLAEQTDENGKGIKDLDLKVGNVKRDDVNNKILERVAIRYQENDENNNLENTRYIIEVVDIKDLEKRRKMDEIAENGNIAKLLVVKDGENYVSLELLNNHYNSNEQQAKELFKKFLTRFEHKPVQPPTEPEVLRENIYGSKIVLDIDQHIEIDQELNSKIQRALNSIDPKMNLTTFLLLSKMLQQEKTSSGYIPVQPEAKKGDRYKSPGELSMALVLRPEKFTLEEIIKQVETIDKNDIEFSSVLNKVNIKLKIFETILNPILKVNKFLVENEFPAAKKGHSSLSLLFTYIPTLFKKVLQKTYRTADQKISKGTIQSSSAGKMEGDLFGTLFTTALTSTVETGLGISIQKGNEQENDKLLISLRKIHEHKISKGKDLNKIKEIAKKDHENEVNEFINSIEILATLIETFGSKSTLNISERSRIIKILTGEDDYMDEILPINSPTE